MNRRRGRAPYIVYGAPLDMRNWRLALHKSLVSAAARLMFVGLCLVEVSLLGTGPPRGSTVQSTEEDLLYVYDNEDDDSSSRRLNNDNRHHFQRRRHSDFGTIPNNDEETHSTVTRNRSGCPVPCRCNRPEEKLHCKGGVSIVRDGCNCCFICARQQGDLCDYRHRCDEGKDQFCDYTLDDGLRGICRAQSGRACDVQGRVYEDGQHFQLNCSQLCTCQNGQYACASLCPQEERAPSKAYCRDLQLVSIGGRCCKEWVCPHSHSLPQPDEEEDKQTKLPGDGGRCVKETTGWSQCSVSCGFGWSVRLTNDNDDCLSVQERRLCIVRSCHLNDKHLQGRQCKTTWKETSSIRIRYDGCVSVKDFRPKYCSTCKRNRCCRPELTKTLIVEMLCSTASTASNPSLSLSLSSHLSSHLSLSNTTIVEKLMWVKSCRCKEIYCKK